MAIDETMTVSQPHEDVIVAIAFVVPGTECEDMGMLY